MENMVDINITAEAKEASHLYLSASIAVVVPAGITVNKVDTPMIRGSNFNLLHQLQKKDYLQQHCQLVPGTL